VGPVWKRGTGKASHIGDMERYASSKGARKEIGIRTNISL